MDISIQKYISTYMSTREKLKNMRDYHGTFFIILQHIVAHKSSLVKLFTILQIYTYIFSYGYLYVYAMAFAFTIVRRIYLFPGSFIPCNNLLFSIKKTTYLYVYISIYTYIYLQNYYLHCNFINSVIYIFY